MSKSKNRICIIHFQPLEKYPPIINILDYLSDKNQDITVISTKSTIGLPSYRNNKVQIVRYPAINEKAIILHRLFQYLLFYAGCFFTLLIKRPGKILYYETLSSLPAIIYYYLSFKRVTLLVHYHEYSSTEEYRTGMFLSRKFHRLEQKIYPNISWLSHTNSQRMEMFINENPNINAASTRIMPNYPPKAWSKMIQPDKSITLPLKIVYVGSVSIDTMYFREFFNWVANQQGKVLFDIYSFSYGQDFLNYVKSLNSPYITLKGNLDYSHFPIVLTSYHVGLILYKAHTPNVKYCASNKLFEYYACGLDVWFPNEMLGTVPYIRKNVYPKILNIDFKNLSGLNIYQLIDRTSLSYSPSTYFYEDVYAESMNSLYKND